MYIYIYIYIYIYTRAPPRRAEIRDHTVEKLMRPKVRRTLMGVSQMCLLLVLPVQSQQLLVEKSSTGAQSGDPHC